MKTVIKDFLIIIGIALTVWFLLSPWQCSGAEPDEVRRLAPKYEAEVEVVLWDRTRVDMVTATHAIEVDWADKWAEAIGQALYYADLTRKKPGIVLLVRDPNEEARFIYRLQTVCVKRGIDFWIERVEG